MADIIDRIIHKLPGESENGKATEMRVMTIRMPTKLHEAIKDEARARKTSANKLAVAKLAITGHVLDRVADLIAAESRAAPASQT
jgi:predicted HicB family RNase H-like nuclease